MMHVPVTGLLVASESPRVCPDVGEGSLGGCTATTPAILSAVTDPFTAVAARDMVSGLRLFWGLQIFLRRPLRLEEAQTVLRDRLTHRERDFLQIARTFVYEAPLSPYRQLLGLIGCEYGDVERLVAAEGVEGALASLMRHGVYLTNAEFKGRQPVVRGSTTFEIDLDRLRNPHATIYATGATSGSRGPGTTIVVDLASIRNNAVNQFLLDQARGVHQAVTGYWGVPGGSALRAVLRYCAYGARVDRWYAQVDPSAPGLHPRYRWSARVVRLASLLARHPLPYPQTVSIEQPLPIARWMAQTLRAGQVPHLRASASSAVRICQAALGAGLDLRGAQFTANSEPTTAARLALIRSSGAEAVPNYSSSETGSPIGYGCLHPTEPDDYHFMSDLNAVIQPGPSSRAPDLPPQALLYSSLRLTAGMVLLNVSIGDQGVIEQRSCNCPLESLGWTTHVHTVRSFEKLTAGGMTFADADIVRVLETVLPARFGGGPTDYQLVEEATPDGQAALTLVVHPSLGALDKGVVREAFLEAISTGSGVERIMGLTWRAEGLLQVERRAPFATASGKIHHVHLQQAAAPLAPASDRLPRIPAHSVSPRT